MYEKGDLVLLPFPFSDLTSSKRRTVLMLTTPDQQGDFVACPITSRSGWSHSRVLSPEDLVDGALPLTSWVRMHKVVTLHTGLIARRFGRVKEAFRLTIGSGVCEFIEAHPTDVVE
jgi:mRNA interferase MazF